MVCEEIDESQMAEELVRWFIRRLDEMNVRAEDEAMSYDCNTSYDFLFFQLQTEAQAYWENCHGYTPTPGQLTKAFFGAEYERARRDRLSKAGWVARFSDYWNRKAGAR